jgi:hypothetical protein
MAEIALILGFAQTGYKLSVTLFSFAQAIGSAGSEIRQTGADIALFSAVLEQLGETLERAQKAGLVTEKAFDTAKKIRQECNSVFGELDTMIKQSTTMTNTKVVKMREDGFEAEVEDRETMAVSFGQRFLHLFRKSRIQEQKRALESLKSSLLLMLTVMRFTENMAHFAAELVPILNLKIGLCIDLEMNIETPRIPVRSLLK